MKLFFWLFFHIGFLSASPLKVGMELSYPPFEMICNDGRPCGVSVDLAMAFGKSIGREVEIENIPFIGLIPSLKNDTIDIIISSLTVTQERKRAIAFSDPYVTTGLCLLINIDSPVKDINQVNKKGVVVVVKSGTSGELYAMKNLENATVRVLDKESTCVLEVIQGKADVFIYDQLSVYTNWKKNPETTKANLEPFQKEYWAFGVKKDNKLLKDINLFLKKFREEGGFEKLAGKYLGEQKAAFKKWGVPFVF
jgi:polar amino acid transport system substrate-binding protein